MRCITGYYTDESKANWFAGSAYVHSQWPSSLMKELDYGKGYRPAHGEAEDYAARKCTYLMNLWGSSFTIRLSVGLEIKIKQKLDHLRPLDKTR